MPRVTYKQAGVDIDAADRFIGLIKPLVKSTARPEVLGGLGGFSGLFRPRLAGMKKPVLVSSTDGVGTKLLIADMVKKYDTVGVDLVAMSVDDVVVLGAEPLFFLDYIAGNGLTNDQKHALVEGVARACAENNCALLGGETADMPDVYPPGEFDLAGFIVGVVERDRVIDGSKVAPGDVLFGIPSSGLHTNGFSLARKALDICNGEPVEETRRRIAEKPSVLAGRSIEECLLETHRPYYRQVAPVLDRVHGMAHITGGGYVENVPRILPEGVTAHFETAAWPVLPIFQLIQQRGEISSEEMYEVFNMGIGLVLMVSPDNADEVAATIPEALRIGDIRPWTGRAVELNGI